MNKMMQVPWLLDAIERELLERRKGMEHVYRHADGRLLTDADHRVIAQIFESDEPAEDDDT